MFKRFNYISFIIIFIYEYLCGAGGCGTSKPTTTQSVSEYL